MILSVSAFVLGLRAISQEDKILGWLREYLLSKKEVKTKVTMKFGEGIKDVPTITHVPRFQEWWYKPLLTCVTCMPSVWGIIVTTTGSLLFFDMALHGALDWIKYAVSILFICISSSFITELMWSIKNFCQNRS